MSAMVCVQLNEQARGEVVRLVGQWTRRDMRILLLLQAVDSFAQVERLHNTSFHTVPTNKAITPRSQANMPQICQRGHKNEGENTYSFGTTQSLATSRTASWSTGMAFIEPIRLAMYL